MPEAGIIDRDKQLHPTDTVGCNYLSLSLIPASGTILIKLRRAPVVPLRSQVCVSRLCYQSYCWLIPLCTVFARYRVTNNSIQTWISNCIDYKVWYEITYPFLNMSTLSQVLAFHWRLLGPPIGISALKMQIIERSTLLTVSVETRESMQTLSILQKTCHVTCIVEYISSVLVEVMYYKY